MKESFSFGAAACVMSHEVSERPYDLPWVIVALKYLCYDEAYCRTEHQKAPVNRIFSMAASLCSRRTYPDTGLIHQHSLVHCGCCCKALQSSDFVNVSQLGNSKNPGISHECLGKLTNVLITWRSLVTPQLTDNAQVNVETLGMLAQGQTCCLALRP